MIKRVDVMGTEYSIDDDVELTNSDGTTDWTIGNIAINKKLKEPSKENECVNKAAYKNKVVRHELLHAIFFECGHECYPDYLHNEVIVDWIAKMFPKLLKIFKDADVVE